MINVFYDCLFFKCLFVIVISYYYFLFLSMLIYEVSYNQCLLNKQQEESSETGINRGYKNSCQP